MFDRVLEWLEAEPDDRARAFDDEDVRTATGVLFLRVVAVDGRVNVRERAWMRSLLQNRFQLGEGEAERMVRDLMAEQDVADVLFPYTTVLNRRLSGEERAEVMRKLTELIFADGKASDVEVAEITRIRSLLKLDTPAGD